MNSRDAFTPPAGGLTREEVIVFLFFFLFCFVVSCVVFAVVVLLYVCFLFVWLIASVRGFSRLVAKLCDGEHFQVAVTLSLGQQGGGGQTLGVRANITSPTGAIYDPLSSNRDGEGVMECGMRRGGVHHIRAPTQNCCGSACATSSRGSRWL